MTTTTIEAIRDALIAKIELISPAVFSQEKFRRAKYDTDLREWAEANAGSAVLRKFEIVESSAPEQPGQLEPAAIRLTQDLTVTVAYPVTKTGAGEKGRDDLADLVKSDARQIRDVLFSGGNYPTGSQPTAPPVVAAIDRDGPVWFQEITVTVQFYEAMSLT